MLIDIADVLALDEYEGANPEAVKLKIEGIESAIRAYTNNDFIIRGARIQAPSSSGLLRGTSPYIKAGDRVQVVRSASADADGIVAFNDMNAGLYDVVAVEDGYIALDEMLYNAEVNDVFLVRYPAAIVAGVFDLLKWEASGRDKVGVSSETISRHSVSYYQFGESEMLMGYPASLMGFLKPYMKARF